MYMWYIYADPYNISQKYKMYKMYLNVSLSYCIFLLYFYDMAPFLRWLSQYSLHKLAEPFKEGFFFFTPYKVRKKTNCSSERLSIKCKMPHLYCSSSIWMSGLLMFKQHEISSWLIFPESFTGGSI